MEESKRLEKFKEVMEEFIKNHSISRCAELALPEDYWNRARFGERDVTRDQEKQSWMRTVRRHGGGGLWDSNVLEIALHRFWAGARQVLHLLPVVIGGLEHPKARVFNGVIGMTPPGYVPQDGANAGDYRAYTRGAGVNAKGYWGVEIKSPEAAVKQVAEDAGPGGMAFFNPIKLKVPPQYYIELMFIEEVLMICRSLEATGPQDEGDRRESLKDMESGCFKCRDKNERAAKLCFPNLAILPGRRICPGGIQAERLRLIEESRREEGPLLGTFYERLFQQADSGTPCNWQALVGGFWDDCSTACKARIVATYTLVENFTMRDEVELVLYELRVSHALQRMAYISHESLRSCSNKALVSGSMQDERTHIISILSSIDSDLGESISSVYDAIDSGCYDVSLDVLLALQTGRNARISKAILTAFHQCLVHALEMLQSPAKFNSERIKKYVQNGIPKKIGQLRFCTQERLRNRNVQPAVGFREEHNIPAQKSTLITHIMESESSEDSTSILAFLTSIWNESVPLEWDKLYTGDPDPDSFTYMLCKMAFDHSTTVQSNIDLLLRNRGMFGPQCHDKCTSSHHGSICARCGFDYGQHCDHTCQHAIHAVNIDAMHARRGKIPIHVRRDDLLGSSIEAISKIPDASLEQELAVSFVGEEGIDAGGLLKSWLSGVTELLVAPGAMLLPVIHKGATTCLRLNPLPSEIGLEHGIVSQRLRLLGVLIGVSFVQRLPIGARLATSVYKLLLGVSPNLEDLADEFPDDYEQLTMIGQLPDSEQDRVLGSLLEDPDSQRHFTTASKLQKLRESIDVAAEVDQSFIPIRDLFKQKHPTMYGAAGDNDPDDTPSALTPKSRDAIVSHENFSEYVNLTVKKQLETNLLPLIAHMKTAFDAVVPLQSRSNLSPQQLKEIVEGRRCIDVDLWQKW